MSEELRWVRTHCARMDHGGCSILAGVADNRIVRIKGDPEGYLNEGYICQKGRASADRLTHPRRLTMPLRRDGERGSGRWRPVPWAAALDEIAERFLSIREREGARAVAFGVGMPKGLDHFVLIRLANLFGSPNVVASQDVCHAPREISGIHSCGFYPVVDLHHPSRLIVLWGSNLTDTNEEGEICSLLLKQAREGTQLLVVDPRRTELAERSALWLQLRPGTDGALALGLLNVIIGESLEDRDFVSRWTHGFEELARHVAPFTPERVAEITWVDAELIRKAARLYAGSKPAALQWGNPIEHTSQAFDTARALICTMAVCGNLGVAGGNVDARDPAIMGLGEFVRADLLPQKRKEMISASHGVIPRFMTVPPAHFRQAVLEENPYPVRGFYAMCSNPLLSWADSRYTREALLRLEIFVAADIFMTPSAALADFVLPAATHFEFDDIGHYGLGHGYILARPRVVEPPGECWPDMRILNELGKRLSPAELWYDDYHRFLEDVLKPSGLDFGRFAELGCLRGPEKPAPVGSKGFQTPTGKVELRLSTAEKFNLPHLPRFDGLPEEDDPAYPLVLTGAKNACYLHSSYRWVERLRAKRPQPLAEIHPQTALEKGIRDGDEVWIETRRGRIRQKARLTERIHPRVVCADHGWWFPEEPAESDSCWQTSNYNMLTSSDRVGREFGTPNLKGIGCRIQRSSTEPGEEE